MEAIYSDFHPRFIYVDKYRFSSNWVYPSSVAPYGLVRYIISGTATFVVNGISYDVGPDDVFYIPQDSVFSCAAKEEIVFISIRFVGSIQSQGTDLFRELWKIPIINSYAQSPEMKRWFEAVYVSALSRHNFKMLEIRGYLNLIISLLARADENNFCHDSSLEEDFFVRTQEYLVPVEVKATKGTAKTLRTLIQSSAYPDIQWGIKLTAGNVGFSDNIYTFPYFCAFLLKDYLKWMNLPEEERKKVFKT